MFRRVAMLRVVVFGMVTVAHDRAALRNWGESSPPLAVKVHDA